MKKYALLGEHLSHSYSPIIQKKLFEMKGLNHSYELIECQENELQMILDKLRRNEYQGFNVTIPYKKVIMKFLEEISPEARAIGSVNTIKYEDGKLCGYNTDYDGFLNTLNFYNIDVYRQNVYILGTGGSSLAIAKVICDLGGHCIFVSRNKVGKENTIDYEDLSRIENIKVIVNTTPVGMYPNMEFSPIEEDIVKKCEVVVDIIFNPTKTKLLKMSKNGFNGLLMLISQAARAQEIWLGKKVDVDYNEILTYMKEMI